MLQAFCEPIREALNGDVEFIVASRHPDADYDARYGVRTVPNFEYSSRDEAAGRWLRGLNPDDADQYMGFVKEVSEADVVVLGPGQFLVETGTAGMLKGALGQALAVVAAARLTATPVYGLALACEDLKSAWAKLTVQTLLDGLAEVTFRDPGSVDNLREAGIELPDYSVLGDLALAGLPAPVSAATALLSEESIPEKTGPRLAMALRNIYWMGLDMDAHRRKMASVMEHWLSHADRDIILVPQNVYDIDGDRDDDRAEAERTLAFLPDALRERVHQIRGKHDASGIEAVYGQADVTLSARLHGAVFSCKQGTPPVMLTFMDKTRGFFRRMEHLDCLVSLDATDGEIVHRLEDFLMRRESFSESLTESVCRNRATSRGYAERVIFMLQATPADRKQWARGLLS